MATNTKADPAGEIAFLQARIASLMTERGKMIEIIQSQSIAASKSKPSLAKANQRRLSAAKASQPSRDAYGSDVHRVGSVISFLDRDRKSRTARKSPSGLWQLSGKSIGDVTWTCVIDELRKAAAPVECIPARSVKSASARSVNA